MAGVNEPLVDVQPATPTPVAVPPRATRPSILPSPLFDLALLHQTAHGNTTFINRILNSFHTNTPASVADLHAALAATDWQAAAAVAHKLRPSLKLIGAGQLMPWLEMLESKAAPDAERQEATQALATGLAEVLAVLPKVVPTA